jgi:hypothetical protein
MQAQLTGSMGDKQKRLSSGSNDQIVFPSTAKRQNSYMTY